MLVELPTRAYEAVRALFQPFDYSLSIRALLEGRSSGCIFVDDLAQPQLAFTLTVEGYLLAGEPAIGRRVTPVFRVKPTYTITDLAWVVQGTKNPPKGFRF